jgi:hypothetical protein
MKLALAWESGTGIAYRLCAWHRDGAWVVEGFTATFMKRERFYAA